MLLNFTTALITSKFRATRTRREYALGRLPGKRRAPGLPSRHPASLAAFYCSKHQLRGGRSIPLLRVYERLKDCHNHMPL